MNQQTGLLLSGLLCQSCVLAAQAPQAAPRLSLDFQNIDIRAALYALAEYADINMVISDAITGQISLRLHDVGWEQALDLILQSRGLEQRRHGKIIRIARQEDMLKYDKASFDASRQRSTYLPLETAFFSLQHRQAGEMKKLLEDSKLPSEQGKLLADASSNTLFISDLPANILRIRSILDKADIQLRQVMIEARIVEASDNFSRGLGVKLNFARSGRQPLPSTPARRAERHTPVVTGTESDHLPHGVNLPIPQPFGSIAALFRATASTLISLELQAMQTENRGRVISSPRLLTADRTAASIEEGSEIPYPQTTTRGASTTLFKKAALSLKVTPQIAPDNNSLWIDIEISKDSPNYGQKVGGAPSVDTKRINTRVLIENGGTVVLGGIFIDEKNKTDNKVPLLGDLPLIGFLFRNQQTRQQRRELLVFITPTILSELPQQP